MFSKEKFPGLLALGIFTFMSTLDGSIVNIALPSMAREMHLEMSQVTWSVTIYLVVISGLILLFGRLGDLLGKTKIFSIGSIVFTLGSLLAGINLGLHFLLFSRIIQAIGASMTMSNSFGITSQLFPPALRARAMSIMSMFVSLGAIAGPAIGGFILQFASWSYIFWINVPLGIVAYLIGRKALPKDEGIGRFKDADLLGATQMFLTIVAFFIAMSLGQAQGFSHLPVLISFVAMIILFIWFIHTERTVDKPLLNLNIFRSKLFSMSVITSMTMFTAGSFVNILMPFYLQDYRGSAAGFAGMVMMAYPVGMFIFSPIAGVLSDKFDKEIITFIAITGVLVVQLGYLIFGQTTAIAFVMLVLFLHGGSVGFFQSPNNALVMSTVESRYLGIAGSVNALARNLGFVLGTTLSTTVLFVAMSSLVGHRVSGYITSRPDIFLTGMHHAFYVGLALVIFAWCLSGYRLVTRKKAVD
ncbi:MFS transporter [Pseudolactococcus plantarum]|uniref:MFS transporter n=1 Tax=Pseudolactococcus plantarum TaxID=1365 RepID=A0A2A5S0D0_9LACT|nr:MFS transporter [Lactococcus plantarum]PCS06914.1 MFS transporter [Lactococcus plantarum]HCN74700.1 MFS transporter [Lactococcus sp.]